MAVQTPQQRIANEKFAKREAAKRGKAEGDRKTYEKVAKSPISPTLLALLGFVVFGGLLFEVGYVSPPSVLSSISPLPELLANMYDSTNGDSHRRMFFGK
ncbi:hypothetical protein Dda_1971 [Drechslerella dactyloides]|uniref:Stress-associated endoplasmic reticulum protein n=1 Tax=Drechslerella dactyloides TaxID=74499 RepID=A0AAD6NNH9_DREDA|nr:hypothetical protein Dda_1971 [Drechslerella dactyloides]